MDFSKIKEQKERLEQLKKDQEEQVQQHEKEREEQVQQLENEIAENLALLFEEFIPVSDKLIECIELFVEESKGMLKKQFPFRLKPEFERLGEKTSVSEKWRTFKEKLKTIEKYSRVFYSPDYEESSS